jgi:RNA polymerase sigma-70 factor, ECF subfamily
MCASRVAADERESAGLIAQARAGSSLSLGKLLANYRGYLLLVANQEVDTDLRAKIAPSDVAQETFLIAHQKFDSFEGTSEHEFRGWLRRILLNRYKDLWREFKATQQRNANREVPFEGDASWQQMLADNGDTPSVLAVASEELAALEKALSQLPDDQRLIIELRNWERITFAEIGERLGKTEDAVRKAWGRAMKRLVDDWHGTPAGPPGADGEPNSPA